MALLLPFLQVAGGAASKLAKIKIVRKSVARILTVYNQKQKAEAPIMNTVNGR